MLVEHGDLKPWATWHANDMVVASNGQAYSGNFGFDLDGLYDGSVESSAIAPASLVRVDPDGTSCEAAADLRFPNGAVITEDGGTLIIAESFGGRLTAFDRQPDGTLTNRRVWATVGGHRSRRHLPLRRRLHLGRQRPGARMRARGRRRCDPRTRHDVDELLRLHAGRRRPAHSLHGHRARQQRRGGTHDSQRRAREGAHDNPWRRPPLMLVGHRPRGGRGTGRRPRRQTRTTSLARPLTGAVTAIAAASPSSSASGPDRRPARRRRRRRPGHLRTCSHWAARPRSDSNRLPPTHAGSRPARATPKTSCRSSSDGGPD